ncbi:hypothetical protein COBT_003984, partial [Conglomerata obtusa]
LEKKINAPTKELKNLFNCLPKNFRARETIIRNDFFAEELIKSLKNFNTKKESNHCETKTKEYDILKAVINLCDESIETVIDTGANFSVISFNLAKKLNLPIKTDIKTNITVANNASIKTYGSIENLPIYINEHYYPSAAIVLEETAQDILLGTNWISRYKCLIDLENNLLKIPRNNFYD